VLIVVDQFEEVFTLCADAGERTRLLSCLLAVVAAEDGPGRVVLGVRADFLAQCAHHPELVKALRDRQMLIGPLTADELRCVVKEPAAHADTSVETALVEAIVAEADGEPGALPLVSHALFETWRRRGGRGMTLETYRRCGGVRGAIAQTAERVFTGFEPDAQTVARNVFLRLTALGNTTEDTRRRVTRAELLDGTDRDNVTTVLDDLAAARLVVLGETSVEVAHEALIRSWPRLRRWLTEDREHLVAHRRLTDAAVEWDTHDRLGELLYRGALLATWENREITGFNHLERDFLEASRRRVLAERTASRRRVRWALTALSLVVVALTVLALVATTQTRRAEDERTLAYARQLAASARAQFQLDPELGLLLARQAFATARTDETEALLRQAVLESRARGVITSHDNKICGVTFSPDGDTVATSGADGAIRLWRLDSEGLPRDPVLLRAHEGDVWSPVFSPDGRLVAAAGNDGVVSVWDVRTSGPAVLLRGHEGQVWSVAFSPDGQRVASVGDDSTVRIWPVRGGDPLVLQGHKARTLGVTFLEDGRVVSSSGDSTVRVWDLTGAAAPIVLQGHLDSVEAVAAAPNTGGDQWLATASTDGTVRAWNLADPGSSLVLGSHDGTAEGVAYSPDGTRVVSTGNDGAVRIWNAKRRGTPLILRGHRGTVNAAAFSPDSRRLISVSEDGEARSWDATETGGPVVLRGHEGAAWRVAAAPAKALTASTGSDGTVRLWNLDTHEQQVLRGRQDGDSFAVAFDPTGRVLASSSLVENVVRLWDVTTGRQLRVLEGHEAAVWALVFSSDGQRVASAGGDGTIRVWPVTGTGEPVVRHGAGSVRSIGFSPDGRLVTGGADGIVRIWDHSGEPKQLRGHRGTVWAVAFSPDGTRLVSGGTDGTVRIWSSDGTGRPVELNGHQGIVYSVAFSPDGRLIGSGGNDGTTRIWQAARGGDPVVVHGFGASVETVTFTRDTDLVTAHDDGSVRAWRCEVCGPVDDVLALARKHTTRDFTPEERTRYLNGPS
jgi:WD40 repeat protein